MATTSVAISFAMVSLILSCVNLPINHRSSINNECDIVVKCSVVFYISVEESLQPLVGLSLKIIWIFSAESRHHDGCVDVVIVERIVSGCHLVAVEVTETNRVFILLGCVICDI